MWTYRNRKSWIILLILLLFAKIEVFTQTSVEAIKFETSPRIDGILDEEFWERAIPVTHFIQREPFTGQPATQETEMYFGFDEHNLYIAIRCFGDPEEIIANEMARDVNLMYDDRVQVILDTYNDKRNAYWFQIGPRGSIGDAIISENGAAFNKAWDGLWTGKAHIHNEGWDAEIAIPFKTLNFNRENDTWGLKLIIISPQI